MARLKVWLLQSSTHNLCRHSADRIRNVCASSWESAPQVCTQKYLQRQRNTVPCLARYSTGAANQDDTLKQIFAKYDTNNGHPTLSFTEYLNNWHAIGLQALSPSMSFFQRLSTAYSSLSCRTLLKRRFTVITSSRR